MGVRFQYPPGDGPYTSEWETDAAVVVSGSALERDRGINAEQMADRRTIRTYREADPLWSYILAFSLMPFADAEDLEDFADEVGGEAFEYKDSCGPITAFRQVQFAVDGYKPKYGLRRNGVSTVISLIDAEDDE